VFALARRFAGDGGGLLAATAYVFSPGVIWTSLALMSEALFVPLVALTLWRLQVAWDGARSRDWMLAGLLLASAALTRSTILYFIPVVVLGLVLRRGFGGHTLRQVFALLGVFFLTVLPWTARNWLVHGEFLLLDSKAGTNLYQYNNPNMVPEVGSRAAAGAPPVPITPDVTVRNGGNEVAQDRRYRELFLEYAFSQPLHFSSVVAARAVLAMSPLPVTNRSPANVATAILLRGPLLGLAIVGWVGLRRRWRESFLLLSLPIYWWILQALSGPGLRYRLPVEFAYAVLAATGVVAIARRWRARHGQGTDGPSGAGPGGIAHEQRIHRGCPPSDLLSREYARALTPRRGQ
jgi:4-amino-4-deoxy-L-arabinose transferase-like glycosyltransferase